MNRKVSFFRCEVCGNMVGLIKDGGGQLVCCGKPMVKLEANTTDASQEKHVPVASRKDGKIHIEIGSAAHPMTEKHFIEWVAVVTDNSTERISLSPGDEPKVVLCECSKPDAEVYAYCNLHGLWKTKV